MMNEEKRDRMIRESLDKYLSGIDALPSQRAAISKSLVDRPPFFRRAAFRAVAVPAALTLLVCAGIGVFAGLQNHTAYPDHVKTNETLVAVQPEPTDFIALAAPEGGEGGADTVIISADGVTWDQWGAVVPTVEPAPEVSVRVAEFISLWREHRWADILEICTPDWTSQYKNPKAELAEIASFVTPGAYEIESVTEIGEKFLGGYSVYLTVRADDNPDAVYRINLPLKMESDSRLYAFPETLKYYEVLAPQELIEATDAERLNRAVAEENPELAAALVPVNMACEDAGIRIEIVSAAMSETDAMVVYSLQDLEGSRISGDFAVYCPALVFDRDQQFSYTTHIVYSHLDPEQASLTCVRSYHFDEPIDWPVSASRISMDVANMVTAQYREIDLVQLLKQYGDQVRNLTDLPGNAYATGIISGSEYTDEELRRAGTKVLDPSNTLNVRLGDNVTLTGISLKDDGLLRLQLRYPDIGSWWFPQFMSASGVPLAGDGSDSIPYNFITWTGNYTNTGCWLEMQFPLNGVIPENASLIVDCPEDLDIIPGTWQIEVPAAQIWAGREIAADSVEAPAAETEETPADKEAAELADQIGMYTGSPELADALLPVNTACEADGFRLEVISAALSGQEALVVYTLEDMQKTGLLADPSLEYPTLGFYSEFTYGSSYPVYCGLNEEKDKITTLMCARFADPVDPAKLPEQLPMGITNLKTTQSREMDLIPLLNQYGSLAGDLAELPESAFASANIGDRMYSDAEIQELGIKVLDPSSALDVPLGENVTLTGIALKEDGILHLQLRYPDIGIWWHAHLVSAKGIQVAEEALGSDLDSCVMWHGSYDNPGCWVELQYPLKGEIGDGASLIVRYTDMPKIVNSSWEVSVPVGQIWVDTLDLSNTAAAESVCIPWNHEWKDSVETAAEEASETPEPAEEPANAVLRDEPYANVRLVKFFRLWREQDWQGMLDMCTSGWKAQAGDPLKALESIARIQRLEIVSMDPLPAVEPEYIMECIVRSGEDRAAWYRLTVTLEKEADGLWYINPESLDAEPLSEEEIASHRTYSTGRSWTYPAFYTEEKPMESLRSRYPRIVDDLVPVGLSCESDGIRLEIISAAIEPEGSLILYSLQDMTGNRVGREKEYNPWLQINDISVYAEGWSLYYLETDAAKHYASYAMYIPGDTLYNAEGNLKCSLDSDLLFYNRKETDLLPHLRKYEDRTWKLADLSEDATLYPYYPGYEMSAKGLGIRVLDSTDPLNIPLDKNVTLNGIGYAEDGLLHIQMHIENNGKLTDSSGYEYLPVFNVAAWRPYTEDAGESLVMWSDEEIPTDSQIEIVFRCTRDSLDQSGLRAAVYTTDSYAHGPWEIEIQTDSVRK